MRPSAWLARLSALTSVAGRRGRPLRRATAPRSIGRRRSRRQRRAGRDRLDDEALVIGSSSTCATPRELEEHVEIALSPDRGSPTPWRSRRLAARSIGATSSAWRTFLPPARAARQGHRRADIARSTGPPRRFALEPSPPLRARARTRRRHRRELLGARSRSLTERAEARAPAPAPLSPLSQPDAAGVDSS